MQTPADTRAASRTVEVDQVVAPGDEVAEAEAWVISASNPTQPWDREEWTPTPAGEVAAMIAPVRERVLAQTLGHYPAPLAILDCVEQGLPQGIEGARRTEMSIFAELIQREEPRNMIQTLFLAKTEYDRLRRGDRLPTAIGIALAAARRALAAEDAATLASAGVGRTGEPVRRRAGAGYWIDGDAGAEARAALLRVAHQVSTAVGELPPDTVELVDYAVVAAEVFPAYLGGPLAFSSSRRSSPQRAALHGSQHAEK